MAFTHNGFNHGIDNSAESGGATNLIVTSNNNTITQNGASTYNQITQTISVDLSSNNTFVIQNYREVAANGVDGTNGAKPSATMNDALSGLSSGGQITFFPGTFDTASILRGGKTPNYRLLRYRESSDMC